VVIRYGKPWIAETSFSAVAKIWHQLTASIEGYDKLFSADSQFFIRSTLLDGGWGLLLLIDDGV
jgi:hypothetical protein